MYKYKILKADGSKEEFESEKLSLSSLQRHVGGFIERLARPELFGIETTGDVYVNEDGKLLRLPANPHVKSTEFDTLVGNILIEEKI